jgi:hypothetical protein
MNRWNSFCIAVVVSCNGAAEKDMKAYLLMMLIGAIFTAIHFTSAPKPGSKTLPR